MDNVLLKAILAMDAYNRGYGAFIDLRPRYKIPDPVSRNTSLKLYGEGFSRLVRMADRLPSSKKTGRPVSSCGNSNILRIPR